jgi:ATP-dependent exoDNAse (exonuclease V) beta subunit
MDVIPAETVTADEPIVWRDAAQGQTDTVHGTDWAAHYREILDRYEAPSEQEMILRRVPTKLAASKMQDKLLDRCIFYQTDLPEKSDGKLPDGQSAEGGAYCDAQSVESIRNTLKRMASAGRQEFDHLLSASRRPSAAERGTATHLFLQYCDYNLVRSHGVAEEIARLAELGFMDARSVKCVDETMLEAFFASSFFGRISKAVRLEREKRFARFVPLSTLTDKAELSEALGDRQLFVQGSIDLIAFYEDGSMEICDYKTDHITEEERMNPYLLQRRMMEAHGDQMAQYVAAAKDMYGERRIRVSVFSLALGEALEMDIG